MAGEDTGGFLSSYEEIHAVWFGLTDALSILTPGEKDEKESLDEPQYYRLGSLIGHLVLLGIGVVLGYLGAHVVFS